MNAPLFFAVQEVLNEIESGGRCPKDTEQCLRDAVRAVVGCPRGCPFVEAERRRHEDHCEKCRPEQAKTWMGAPAPLPH